MFEPLCKHNRHLIHQASRGCLNYEPFLFVIDSAHLGLPTACKMSEFAIASNFVVPNQ
jgi:hypothetical protein